MLKANTCIVITTERESEKGIANHNNLYQIHVYSSMCNNPERAFM